MVSNIAEIKAQSTKEVTLPSGLTVMIRRLWLSDFIGVGEVPFSSGGDGNQAQPPENPPDQKTIYRVSARVVARGCVDPPFSDQDGDEMRDDVVHVRDLTLQDFEFLATAILQWSGLGREGTAAAESFRTH